MLSPRSRMCIWGVALILVAAVIVSISFLADYKYVWKESPYTALRARKMILVRELGEDGSVPTGVASFVAATGLLLFYAGRQLSNTPSEPPPIPKQNP